MLRRIGLVCVLLVFWLLLSGHYTVFLITLGIFACMGAVWLLSAMAAVDEESAPFQLAGRALVYWPWLLVEIVKSALGVCRVILHPRLPVSPAMRAVKASQRTPLGRIIFANSITLTPGTISVHIGDEDIVVHALEAASLDELDGGEMDRRARAVEPAP